MESLIARLRDTQALAKLIGEAPAFLKAIAPVPLVAKSDATVLITGETGTGKELVARALHYLSPRAAFPFVPANCGRLPDTLLEDELFGHERGAFTDAHAQRKGLIAFAEKGTLFLDEIEALSPKAQVVLLRVLQEKKFIAVGSSREQAADVRIVAATNAPLEELVRAGSFRADLYYRICVFSINLPPLRERREDILPLAQHFVLKHAPQEKEDLELSQEAREALMAHDWPGNVRELENTIIRGVNLCQEKAIAVEDLGLPNVPQLAYPPVLAEAFESYSFNTLKQQVIDRFEQSYLSRLLQQHRGNVSHAAIAAGKDRRNFGKLLKKYRIDPKLYY